MYRFAAWMVRSYTPTLGVSKLTGLNFQFLNSRFFDPLPLPMQCFLQLTGTIQWPTSNKYVLPTMLSWCLTYLWLCTQAWGCYAQLAVTMALDDTYHLKKQHIPNITRPLYLLKFYPQQLSSQRLRSGPCNTISFATESLLYTSLLMSPQSQLPPQNLFGDLPGLDFILLPCLLFPPAATFLQNT